MSPPPASTPILAPNSSWWVYGALGGVMLVLYLSGSHATEALQFERQWISDRQWWRFLGANLVHSGGAHLAMNLIGLVIVALISGRTLGPGQVLVAWIVTSLATTLGLWFLNPGIQWYLGASGALHGMLIAVALPLALKGDFTGVALSVLLAVKLAWEQLMGPLPGSEESLGTRVVVDAHLYGALGGVLFIMLSATISQIGPTASTED